MKYLEYLRELRNRLLFSFSFMFFCFLFFFFNINLVVDALTNPLYQLLNNQENQRMIFTGLPEVFVSNLKLSLFVAFLFSLPIFIIQIILFTSPALYRKEKKVFVLVSIMSIVFFFLGILFAYFFLIPMIWSLIPAQTPARIKGSANLVRVRQWPSSFRPCKPLSLSSLLPTI